MASTIDIRRRIKSVKNTMQITKAMKMVAAAKLRRAQERMIAARPYAAALRTVLASIGSRVQELEHPLLAVRPENRVLLLVVTGDKGLAGAFNTNIIKASQNALKNKGWPEVQLIPIGRKGNDFYRRRKVPIRHQAINIQQAETAATAREIARMIVEDFIEERIDAVYIQYNEFRSVMQQTVRLEKLLPLDRIEEEQDGPGIDYLYEPEPEKIITELIPRHIEFQIYRVLLESSAAEQGARMTAMGAASKNASEMIDSLTLSYNRIRQASITTEIIEIVSGAAALG